MDVADLPRHERDVVGPRRAGVIVHSMAVGTSRVDAVLIGAQARAHIPWSDVAIVETDLGGTMRGRQRVHCTAWDDRDQTLLAGQPDPALTPAPDALPDRPHEHLTATIADAADQIRAAAPGRRRTAMFAAAYTLGSLIAHDDLAYTDAHHALTRAARAHIDADLSARDVDIAIAEGIERGIRLTRQHHQRLGHQHEAAQIEVSGGST